MKTKNFLPLLLVILITVPISISQLYAQVDELWASRYNGTGNGQDEVSAMTVDPLGNVYVTGRSRGTGFNNNFDYLTIKYDPLGDTVWVRRYDGGGLTLPTDEAKDIAVDNLGFVYVTGFSVATDMTSDFLTIKYASNGDTVWIKRYSFSAGSNDDAYSLAIDENSNVFVTGRTNGDYLTIAYDASGIFQWSARYNGPGNDQDIAKKIIYDSGSLYVTGLSRNTFNSSTSADYATIKYNTDGDSAWVRRYNGPNDNYDEPTSIAGDSAGNVYVTGFSRNTTFASSADYLTIKYNTSGDSAWVRRYDGTANGQDEANDIAVDDSGNVYITGTSTGTFADYATIKYNSTGSQQWIARYHGPFNMSNDYAHSIAISGNGFIYVTGGSQISSLSHTDIATLKYNTSGEQQWLKSYNGTGNQGDVGYHIAIFDTDYIYVAGNSSGGVPGLDYITIKYEKVTGITGISNNTPTKFHLYQNYPNPFNPSTRIKFDLPQAGNVKLRIFDLVGREIAVPVNSDLSAGSYEYEWNASSYATGIYFYELQTENHRETKKLVLSK